MGKERGGLSVADEFIAPTGGFALEVEGKSGQPINKCYQCKKCAGGCPMSFAMEPYNADLLRLIQLGAKDAALKANTTWLCVACKTCGARCPNGIDISKVADTLREMALAAGIRGGETKTPAFYQSFLTTVEHLGRAYEAGTIGLYKLKTASYTQDMALGLKFLAKGKLKLLPDRVKGQGEIKRIFRQARRAKA
jgi:heterodisulfide reductase subunit C